MEITPVLPKAGQELRYFMEYFNFFVAYQDFLFIYSMISHRTPHDVLYNCIWETLSQIINECGTLAEQ
jgi:hypothetical protein